MLLNFYVNFLFSLPFTYRENSEIKVTVKLTGSTVFLPTNTVVWLKLMFLGSILKAKSQDLEHQEGSGRVGGTEVCHQGGGGRVGGAAVKICPHRHKVTAVCRHCIGR